MCLCLAADACSSSGAFASRHAVLAPRLQMAENLAAAEARRRPALLVQPTFRLILPEALQHPPPRVDMCSVCAQKLEEVGQWCWSVDGMPVGAERAPCTSHACVCALMCMRNMRRLCSWARALQALPEHTLAPHLLDAGHTHSFRTHVCPSAACRLRRWSWRTQGTRSTSRRTCS